MTRLTALFIQNDSQVYGTSFGPVDGKFGAYIGTWDETPSGCSRPRHLLTSEPIYATADEAKTAAEKIIADVRAKPPAEDVD